MKKLALNKETIRRLTTNEMRAVAGGQFDFRRLTGDPELKPTFDCDPTWKTCDPSYQPTCDTDTTGSFDCD
jgi:hypothetical protein